MPITDEALADEVIARLNKLLEDPDVRKDIGKLLEQRVPVSKGTWDHPTIQVVQPDDDHYLVGFLGFLGVLNGLVGTDPKLVGPRRGWGYIAANFDDDMQLTNFQRVKNKEQVQT